MYFSIEKKKLLKGISKVLGLTSRKSNLSITSTILISAKKSQIDIPELEEDYSFQEDSGQTDASNIEEVEGQLDESQMENMGSEVEDGGLATEDNSAKDMISIYATDLETGFIGFYPADNIKEGQIAVPARKFYEIVNDFPGETINIEEEDEYWIKIYGNEEITKSRFNIVGMDPADFPSMYLYENIDYFHVDAKSLKNMVEKGIIAGEADDSRAHFKGLFLIKKKPDNQDNEFLRIVSTDGSRLIKVDCDLKLTEDQANEDQANTDQTNEDQANDELKETTREESTFVEIENKPKNEANVETNENVEQEMPANELAYEPPVQTSKNDLDLEKGVIVSKKGMAELTKLLDSDGVASIALKDKTLVVTIDNETFMIRLLDGDFPDYDEIIPKEGNIMKVDRQTFMGMMKRMSILSTERYPGVKLNVSDNLIEVTTTNPEIGDSREEIGVEYEGKNFQIGFNPQFFIDSVKAIKSDLLWLKFIDENNPCIIQGENDESFISVIMPMKID